MNKTSYKFLLYIGAIAIISLMVYLGFWQLSRAEEKQNIQNFVNNQQSQRVNLEEQNIMLDMLYQQGHASGKFLVQQAILIDNQVYNGLVGYHVIVPFQVSKSEQLILVNVGWVAVGKSRSIKPVIHLPEDSITISGRLQKPHAKPPFWLDKYELIQDGVWQFLPISDYIKDSNLTVAPLILELDSEQKEVNGFQRQWLGYDDKWINRHKAYALQWFSMAVVFLLMCLVLEFRSRKN